MEGWGRPVKQTKDSASASAHGSKHGSRIIENGLDIFNGRVELKNWLFKVVLQHQFPGLYWLGDNLSYA